MKECIRGRYHEHQTVTKSKYLRIEAVTKIAIQLVLINRFG